MALFGRRAAQAEEPVREEGHVYLIDTENVRSVWTLLLDNMTAQDKIYVFFTMNSGNVSYENLNGILSSGKQVELMECFTGKNGLDFQLVSYLGFLIRDNESAEYIIISDDGGYDAAIRFWEKKGFKVSRKTAAEVTGKPAKTGKKGASKSRGLLHTKSTKTAGSATKAGETATKKSDPEKKVVRRTVTTKKPIESATTAESPVSAVIDAKIEEVGKAVEAPVKVVETAKPDAEVSKSVSEAAQSAVEAPKAERPKASKPKSEKPKAGAAANDSAKTAPEKEAAPKPALTPNKEKLTALLPEEDASRISQIYDLLVKAGSPENLADIHDGIEKIYRDEHGTEVYRILRPKMKDIFKA
jgi:hypothetical protein